ncbi:DUF3493 domain-containing protein [filamentous cyanobacterium LEGE 11480]|uniref:DUF3493 domain-containing protein n=1 Tax=Romeriopsis navalis LEGE 11480 TaxID=2777977 RepID=A0A928Z583_9CYAN|nr:DUF3493 domain-containing protein [Romeriopsis navalis]MBE9030980.1 DUF3493 domain-containing protein [Romeriopsis navalis LEGE 11480]
MSQSLREKDPDKYASLVAEAQAPFRNLRLFVYAACSVSGAVGGFVFFFRILAGRDLSQTIPNFAVQAGVVALTTWLFLKETKAKKNAIATVRDEMQKGAYPSPEKNLKKSL